MQDACLCRQALGIQLVRQAGMQAGSQVGMHVCMVGCVLVCMHGRREGGMDMDGCSLGIIYFASP